MTTKVHILVLAVFGNLGLATIFLLLNLNQLADQEKAYLDDAAAVYQQAWSAAADSAFENSVGLWHHVSGEPAKAAIWSEPARSDLFPPATGSEANGNPQLAAIVRADEKDTSLLQDGQSGTELMTGAYRFRS